MGLLSNTTTIDAVPGGTYTMLMGMSGKKFSILDFDLFTDSLQIIVFKGLVNTLKLSLMAFAAGIAIGLVMGIGRTSHNSIIRIISSIYVEGVRGLPLLLQLLFVFFGLPFLIADYTGGNFNIDIFTAAIIALSVNCGAYTAEIFKKAYNSLDLAAVTPLCRKL
jgi:His/Glu/Gln/Arg/opine family amino acid ABC transporter permease subunit